MISQRLGTSPEIELCELINLRYFAVEAVIYLH